MKKLIKIIFGLIFVTLIAGNAGKVWASEGMIRLNQENDSGTSCVALSVYKDQAYRILGTCRNLKMPYVAEAGYYVLWEETADGKSGRVATLEEGKFQGVISNAYAKLYITAEADNSPRSPSKLVVASGEVSEINFGQATSSKTTTGTQVIEGGNIDTGETVSADETSTGVGIEAASPTQNTTESRLVSFLTNVGRFVGITFLVLLGGAVVVAVVTRRRGA